MSEASVLSKDYELRIPRSVSEERRWKPGQEFAFIPKGKSILVVPIPTIDELRGIAKGADPSNYRDRNDRY